MASPAPLVQTAGASQQAGLDVSAKGALADGAQQEYSENGKKKVTFDPQETEMGQTKLHAAVQVGQAEEREPLSVESVAVPHTRAKEVDQARVSALRDGGDVAVPDSRAAVVE
jgi:hypothetical protein